MSKLDKAFMDVELIQCIEKCNTMLTDIAKRVAINDIQITLAGKDKNMIERVIYLYQKYWNKQWGIGDLIYNLVYTSDSYDIDSKELIKAKWYTLGVEK